MSNIIISYRDRNPERGAVSYGIPTTPAVESFISDVAPKSEKERLIGMFFCGSPSSCLNNINNSLDLTEDDI